MLEVGAAQKDITAFKAGIGMMGYGMHFNVVHDIETPLLVRAFVFRHPETGRTAALVVADMAFITDSVKRGVVKRLERKHPEFGLHEENMLLSAQHTHSGPGGYSHYGLYNITIPGFVPEVYQQLVTGISDALIEAWGKLKPAKIRFNTGEFEPEIPVAFNRSMKAFLRNPEAAGLTEKDSHLAIDREMRMLRFDGLDGEKIGAVNWFGVHTTSVHNDNHSLCWDNKGYAADFLEKDIRQTENGEAFIGAFAQGAAGDVTPNYVWDKKKKWTRGRFENDFESARDNGKMQYEKAKEVYEGALDGHLVQGGLDWGQLHVNFANVQADPEFAFGKTDARTDSACHGLAFFAGTTEGPGMPPVVKAVAKFASVVVKGYEFATLPFRKKSSRLEIKQKYFLQGKKNIIVEAGNRRILGTGHVKKLIVPGFADPTIKFFKVLHPKGWEEDKPWTPHILPLQILVLGDLALVAIPGEPTTVAARRIRKVVEDTMLSHGIHQVLILPYANSYCGYITTHEEYQQQAYEGGHTVYGHWTLAAFQTKFKQLAAEMVKKADYRELQGDGIPPEFTAEELGRRTHDSKLRSPNG
ncbi:MAG: neutral/alkaline non-lysosomal ceramidase N-terminal domain-containing protein [Bacteroidetes bacterium]|nr:neutral/alkaline non-lysosomal ceramidase N-terminal domain-containing protein [Bacteroidota bacterium]